MIEEFDANTNTDLTAGLTLIASLVLLGLITDFVVLRTFRRRAREANRVIGQALFTALSGQPTFWSLVASIFFSTPILGNSFPGFDLLRTAANFSMPLAVTVFVLRFALSWVAFYFESQQLGSVSLINNTVRFLAILVVTATILALAGIPIGPLLTVVAGSSVGLSLALREPLANLFAGMVIIASNKVRLGDYVRLTSGEEGHVTDIRWSDTSILSILNNLVVIPNSQITSSLVTNFNRPDPELLILFEFFVGYNNDLQRIEQIAAEVALEVVTELDGGVSEYEPLIRFNAFQDSSIKFLVIFRAKTFVDQYLLKHELGKRIHAHLLAEGITLPYPVRVLHVPQTINIDNGRSSADIPSIETYD
jgi:small-conductance mechanosensitive channel